MLINFNFFIGYSPLKIATMVLYWRIIPHPKQAKYAAMYFAYFNSKIKI